MCYEDLPIIHVKPVGIFLWLTIHQNIAEFDIVDHVQFQIVKVRTDMVGNTDIFITDIIDVLFSSTTSFSDNNVSFGVVHIAIGKEILLIG